MRNGKVEKVENQYVTDFLTDESIKFVDKNKKDGTKPFFLWLAYNAHMHHILFHQTQQPAIKHLI
jgi:hypothetical protein